MNYMSFFQKDFERQLRYLSKIYRILHPLEFLHFGTNNKRFPSRSVLVTFDDGFNNIFQYALPVVERLKIPIVVFLLY